MSQIEDWRLDLSSMDNPEWGWGEGGAGGPLCTSVGGRGPLLYVGRRAGSFTVREVLLSCRRAGSFTVREVLLSCQRAGSFTFAFAGSFTYTLALCGVLYVCV